MKAVEGSPRGAGGFSVPLLLTGAPPGLVHAAFTNRRCGFTPFLNANAHSITSQP